MSLQIPGFAAVAHRIGKSCPRLKSGYFRGTGNNTMQASHRPFAALD